MIETAEIGYLAQTKQPHSLLWFGGTFAGVVLGAASFLPVYYVPNGELNVQIDPMFRVLRLALPSLVVLFPLLFSGMRVMRRRVSQLGLWQLFSIFSVFPVLAAFFSTSLSDSFYFGFLPLLISLVPLVGGVLATQRFWSSVIFGIGLVAVSLIFARIQLHGVETTTYYFRPRAHFGFFHPLVTASAIIATLWLWLLLIESPKIPLKRCLAGLGFSIALAALYIADSRNSLLFLCLWGFGALITSFANRFGKIYFSLSVLAVWCTLPTSILWVLFSRSDHSTLSFSQLDSATSGRLGSAWTFVDSLVGNGFNLLGPSWERQISGFAGVDSVFLSYWGHFGFLPFVGLLAFWLWLGMRLREVKCKSTLDLIAIGTWFGLTGFFVFDGQGLTPSNLPLFFPLAWLVRIALLA